MLSAQAYSFRQKSKLAISLSWVGGYTNVVGLLVCATFISHMTGVATWLGRDLVERDGAGALFFGGLLAAFWLGAVASAVMTETARRRGAASKYVVPMAVEAMLLSIFAMGLARGGVLAPDGAARFWLAATGAFAMGLQNATITMISGAVVRTTHLTGVMTDLGVEGVQYAMWYLERARGRRGRGGRLLRVSRRHPTALRLLLLASIFGSFLFGVIAGTFMFHHHPRVALVPPILFLLWIIFMDWWRPIADVREIDLLSDPELKVAGLMHDLLPAGLGIYRLSPRRHGRESRAPNFQFWADILPPRWRVVILALTPAIRFDANAALDLRQAVQTLRARGRRLILCGVNPAQYATLEAHGLTAQLGWENLCPDLEFAISRGIELVREDHAVER